MRKCYTVIYSLYLTNIIKCIETLDDRRKEKYHYDEHQQNKRS